MNASAFGDFAVDPAMPVAGLLAAAVVLACAQLLHRQWRTGPAQRSRGWRVALLLLAQPVCAALLYFALLPPTVPGEAGTMVVATAGAAPAQLDADAAGETRVALPEAPPVAGAERVPDLATALRRHPGTRRVRIVGTGLDARDRDAVREFEIEIEFQPAALPRGLVELAAPHQVATGAVFRVGGRAEGLPGGRAELLDPGRQRVDRVALATNGRFVLTATTRVAGMAAYRLRLRDAKDEIAEEIEMPLQTVADTAPRVLVLAGAPGPELKYLRRWARDAGMTLHTRISVGGGMQLGDAPLALNVANLGRFDLVVLDERAWSSLDEAQRGALVEALRGGLGVLLRVTGPLSERERGRLRALGFVVDAGRDSTTVRLPRARHDDDDERARIGPGTRDAPHARDAPVVETPALTRRVLRIDARDASPLLSDEAGNLLAAWRAEGRGRVAVWTLTDSYRLVLSGRGDLHGELWSKAVATMARPQPRSAFVIEGEARQDQRIALCGLAKDARVLTPAGAAVALLRDPATGARACAAFWPHDTGWHLLLPGDPTQPERSQAFAVRARDAAAGLHAGAVREATQQLAASPRAATPTASASAPRHPGPRWPWWLAWLLASAGLWWLERARVGRVVRSPA